MLMWLIVSCLCNCLINKLLRVIRVVWIKICEFTDNCLILRCIDDIKFLLAWTYFSCCQRYCCFLPAM